MRTRAPKAFTLVELLIVVVILGILAAIVVPQFSNASDSAIKGALKSQLQTVTSQTELYKVQNAGTYPTLGGSASNNGWGVMITSSYLKAEPYNAYVAKSNIAVGTSSVMTTLKAAATSGWATDNAGTFWAVGFNPAPATGFPDGKFSHE